MDHPLDILYSFQRWIFRCSVCQALVSSQLEIFQMQRMYCSARNKFIVLLLVQEIFKRIEVYSSYDRIHAIQDLSKTNSPVSKQHVFPKILLNMKATRCSTVRGMEKL